LFGLVASVIGILVDLPDLLPTDPSVARETKKPSWATPRASGERLAVVVAQLELDSADEFQTLLIEGLREIQWVEVLAVDEVITSSGPEPERTVKDGHNQAREILARSGADVMLWGKVLGLEGNKLPKLYWTTADRIRGAPEWGRYRITGELELPELFWRDLKEVLGLLVATQYATNFTGSTLLVDELSAFAQRVWFLVEGSPEPSWDRASKTTTRLILARALSEVGRLTTDADALRAAVDSYHVIRDECSIDDCTLHPLTIESELGIAMLSLGELEPGVERLEEATDLFRTAIETADCQDRDTYRRGLQINLAHALVLIGERSEGTEKLYEAAQVLREVSTYTRTEFPLYTWAIGQVNLGDVLRALGERERDTSILRESAIVSRGAATVATRERMPLLWAMAQNNLGLALGLLGTQEDGTKLLEEAIAAYRLALEERTTEVAPADRADTLNNMGIALRIVGERTEETATLEEALSVHRMATGSVGYKDAPVLWAQFQDNLAATLRALGENKHDLMMVCDALGRGATARAVFREAGAEPALLINHHQLSLGLKTLKEEFDADLASCEQTLHRISAPFSLEPVIPY